MVKKNTLSSLDHLKDLSIAPGAVFIGPWDGIDHEKYLIVAAVNPERILVSIDDIRQFFGEEANESTDMA